VEHAVELKADLIVMCTHGRGGLREVLFGSIAQQVTAQGSSPVLLVRPPASGPPPAFKCDRVLAPDDATAEHEPGLDLIAALAARCASRIRLVMVVETAGTLTGREAASGTLLPTATRLMLEMAQAGAEKHLAEHVRLLQAQGVQASAEVRRGDPAQALAQAARQWGADVVVIRTHGKAGTKAFWSASLAPRLAAAVDLPLLLIPVGGG